MNRLTLADLEELERLEAAATPGLWRRGIPACDCADAVQDGESSVMLPDGECIAPHALDADAALISRSRNALKDLIALAKVGLLAQEKAP